MLLPLGTYNRVLLSLTDSHGGAGYRHAPPCESVVAPLLSGSLTCGQSQAKTDRVVPIARAVAEAKRRTAVLREVAPTATARHAVSRARQRSYGVSRVDGIVSHKPIKGPLKHIAMHVEQSPCIRQLSAHLGELRISLGLANSQAGHQGFEFFVGYVAIERKSTERQAICRSLRATSTARLASSFPR